MDGTVNGPGPHRMVNPSSLAPPRGYSHVVEAASGRSVYLAGQTALGAEGWMPEGFVEQFDAASANVVRALEAADARPEHVVSLQIFVTDLAAYLGARQPIGEAYRRHFGAHYPAMALIEVKGLVGGAMVELMAVAVVPLPDGAPA